MPSVPAPEKFDSRLEEWSQYMDRIQYYFAANHTLERDKLPTFLSLLSREVYSTLCQLLSPIHPSTTTFVVIVDTLNKYFKPRILIPVERLRFIKRKQETNESIKDFVKALRHLSTNCNYGDAQALDNRLSEQFIYGIRDNKIQEKFLIEENLTFDEAIKIAIAIETADRGAQELKAEPTLSNVLFHDSKSKDPQHQYRFQNSSNKCVHCGFKNHKSVDCKFKDASCHKCGIKGHIASICKTPMENSTKSTSSRTKTKSRPVNALNVNEPKSTEDDVLVTFNRISVNYANETSISPIMLDINIKGMLHKLQLDTGTGVSIIPRKYYEKYFNKCNLVKTNIVLATLREKIRPLGKIIVDASFINKKAKNLEIFVIEDPAPGLIGLSWVDKLDILDQLVSRSWVPVLSKFEKADMHNGIVPPDINKKLINGINIDKFLQVDPNYPKPQHGQNSPHSSLINEEEKLLHHLHFDDCIFQSQEMSDHSASRSLDHSSRCDDHHSGSQDHGDFHGHEAQDQIGPLHGGRFRSSYGRRIKDVVREGVCCRSSVPAQVQEASPDFGELLVQGNGKNSR